MSALPGPRSVDAESLEQKFRKIIAALQLVAAGTIYSYSPVGTKTGFSSSMPTTGGGTEDLRRSLVERWGECPDDDARRALIVEAQGKLDELVRGNRAPVKAAFDDAGKLRAWALTQGRGFTAFELASKLRCSETMVRKWRKAEGVDGERGTEPIKGETRQQWETTEERRRRVRELKARNPGMTRRQIGAIVGCHHDTVKADLASDAA